MRILLYGGSFDPPHYGHLNNLRAAAARVCPDRVVVMPAGVSPFKQGTSAPGPLRVEMCGCVAELAREMGFGLEVSGWEVEQAALGRRNYTVLTLEMLARTYPEAELYMAMGSDMLLSFDGWYRWQVTLPADVLSERAADQKIGEITGIEVRRRSEGSAAATVLIEEDKGYMEIEGEYQIRKFLSAKGWPIQKNDGTVSCEMELLPSACFIVVPEKEGETVVSFTIYGGGYSHGVGMSQNGAKHLAEQGKSYEEILRYFYQNIEIGDCRSLF